MSTKSSTPDLRVTTIPDIKNYKMNDWQIKQFTQFIYNNIGDVHNYIEEHREEYEKWLGQEEIEEDTN